MTDLNHDGQVDATDIDVLVANRGSSNPAFDLTGDGEVGQQDVDQLVLVSMERRYGDTDLNQRVDIHDFNIIAIHFDPTGQNPDNGWATGDMNGDGLVDVMDVNILANNFSPLGYGALDDAHSNNLPSNNKHVFDTEGVDLMYAGLVSDDPLFDHDHDRDADPDDAQHVVLNRMGERFGDTYLDNDVDPFYSSEPVTPFAKKLMVHEVLFRA